MEGWIEIIAGLLSGTTMFGIFEAIRYRRENKKLKQNEVKVSNVDAQRQEIELAELYKDKMLELVEQVSTKQDIGNINQQAMMEKLDHLSEQTGLLTEHDKNQEALLTDIVTYLNGDFQKFLKMAHQAHKGRKGNENDKDE